jgi:tetratricopeptide (TPR) repeat protein/DNA-binding XRE family transcriptional regulator
LTAEQSTIVSDVGGSAFGAQLRRLRVAHLLSQSALAQKINYSRSYLCKIESGQKAPTPDLARRCDEALDADGVLIRLCQAMRKLSASSQTAVQLPPRPPPPAELPYSVTGFVARRHEMEGLHALLTGGASNRTGDPRQARLVVISGMAGVGKTALAVHFGYETADRFPDGQIYLDLRGFGEDTPLSADEALSRLLRSLGTDPRTIPTTVDERTVLYRSLMANRRMFILLDNASSAEQVQILLPGTSPSLTLVTSRRRLLGLMVLYGICQLTLEPLDRHDALILLSSMIGADRLAVEHDAAEQLVQLCGYLPLAVRIAAAHLTGQSNMPVADAVSELTASGRLHRLVIEEGPAIGAAFGASYRRLESSSARLFRLLSLVSGPDFTPGVAAALAGLGKTESRDLLAGLAAEHLVQSHAAGRYRFHDLVRLYAAHLVQTIETEQQRYEAVKRLLTFYLDLTVAAGRRLYAEGRYLPDTVDRAGQHLFGDDGSALAWLEQERPNVVAAVVWTVERLGPDRLVWLLADAIHMFCYVRAYSADWSAVVRAGLTAALRSGDRCAEAAMRRGIAMTYRGKGQFRQASVEYEQALDASRDSGWRPGEATILSELATVREELDLPYQVVGYYHSALASHQALNDRLGEATVLGNLSGLLWQLGQLDQARDCVVDALSTYRSLGLRLREANCMTNLANILHELGILEQALANLTEALIIHQDVGFRLGEAVDLCDLGGVYRDLGELKVAINLGQRALELARDIGHRWIEVECLNALADHHLVAGSNDLAVIYAGQARNLAETHGYSHGLARSLIRLASAAANTGDLDPATRHGASALALARRCGYRLLEGNAILVLGEIALAKRDHNEAIRLSDQAMKIHQETNHRAGRDRAAQLLDAARRQPG